MRFISCLPGRIINNTSVIVFAFEGARKPVGSHVYGRSVDDAYLDAKQEGFSGKNGQISVMALKDGRFERAIFVGLGKESDATLDHVRRGMAWAARRARSLNARVMHVKAPSHLAGAFQTAQAVAEGTLLGLYRYTGFQTKPDLNSKLESLFMIASNEEEDEAITYGLRRGTQIAYAVAYARDLINRPPSDATPEFLMKEAKTLIDSKVGISVNVFDKKRLEKIGMGGLLGVNRGSHQPPYFLHLTYKPAGKIKRKIGLCGKGITFDSGGLSLKPAGSMETMKYDMSGAASVLAVFRALSYIRPKAIEVHGFTPLTENMPGGNALKPGDVFRALNGKTVEVLNTDAEGRLVLADALSYASLQKLDEVFDIATLTGACMIALGSQIAGMMGNNAKLLEQTKAAAKAAGEKVWELPLEKEYTAHIRSQVADLKNIGPAGQAGTILAGLFLQEFVDPKLPWVHLDIASTGWTAAPTALSDTGSTGVLIRTLIQHLFSYVDN